MDQYRKRYFSGYWPEKEDFEFPEQKVIAERYTDCQTKGLDQAERYLEYKIIKVIFFNITGQIKDYKCRAREKRQKLKKFGLFLYIEKTIESKR